MIEFLVSLWHYYLASAAHVIIAGLLTIHILLHKRHPRAATGWIGLVWLSPFIGAIIYGFFGVNRISRKAQRITTKQNQPRVTARASAVSPRRLEEVLDSDYDHLRDLVRVGDKATDRFLLDGNRVEPLLGGDAAYPRMIEAIRGTERSITMLSYIFDHDRAGERFVEALAEARQRGVAVRVIIDAVGARYKKPRTSVALKKLGVPVAEFLPTRWSRLARYANLRNHRKLLILDGKRGFTGGMNIREEHMLSLDIKHPEADLHFSVDGPVVAHMQKDFAVDWDFCTGEMIEGDLWFPTIDRVGDALARGIPEGPDENLYQLGVVIMAAMGCARSSIHLCTPYFLPEEPLLAELGLAAMRGVQVDILLPEKTNNLLVQWASTSQMATLLRAGCRIWRIPEPFEHTKLMLVDGIWSLFGSANLDPRSLRLNFEFNVECYDRALNTKLEEILADKLDRAEPVALEDIESRGLPIKLRDNAARLASPYL
jgi:cardiolipin synthase